MHTTALDSCRIHHGGDFEGDVIITNTDSTSKPIGPLATINFTVRKLINLQRKLEVLNHNAISSTQASVCLKNRKTEEEFGNPEIRVLESDVKSFLALRLMSKIEDKLGKAPYESLLKIARDLGVTA